uniref:Uncharacterized protein n=1 Tax=Chromera velia CCMP2878 TaxID=1169474 RepID=A0A0G4IDU5_9ALVE|eukprot:Cvel_13527.t1-p1 / transcript=Cvel_13527.t1 / gene=Cvel_13527 / organism=Chromera_velia_CCMP2878 / gene_product=hypothetical protein / transcript_product=hypothetical protein / location=Cvel_scaffold928:15226-16441(+) / protein_length=188 / sequence_SO=supercontig / SO=protein_coding / is_pseudo=false
MHVIAYNRQVVSAPLLPNPPPATAAAQQEDQQEEKDDIPPSLCDSASEVSSDEDEDEVDRDCCSGKIRELFSILAADGEEVEVKLDLFYFINRMLKAAKQGHPYFALYAKELQKAYSILRASDLDKLIEVECSGEGGARNRGEAWKHLTPQLIAEVVRLRDQKRTGGLSFRCGNTTGARSTWRGGIIR